MVGGCGERGMKEAARQLAIKGQDDALWWMLALVRVGEAARGHLQALRDHANIDVRNISSDLADELQKIGNGHAGWKTIAGVGFCAGVAPLEVQVESAVEINVLFVNVSDAPIAVFDGEQLPSAMLNVGVCFDEHSRGVLFPNPMRSTPRPRAPNDFRVLQPGWSMLVTRQLKVEGQLPWKSFAGEAADKYGVFVIDYRYAYGIESESFRLCCRLHDHVAGLDTAKHREFQSTLGAPLWCCGDLRIIDRGIKVQR